MKPKKETKSKAAKVEDGKAVESAIGAISSRAELKTFLLSIRDKMEEGTAAPIYSLSAMNHLMTQPGIYSWLDNETKEIARDIWLRLKQAGLQIRNPGLLFSAEEGNGVGEVA